MKQKTLNEFKELNQIANAMSSEAWGALLVQGILGDPDWFYDMVNESIDRLHRKSLNWFGEYHGVFMQFSSIELAAATKQYSEYIKPWEESLKERITNER